MKAFRVRQAKPGGGERPEEGGQCEGPKPLDGTQRVRIPPGKGWPPAGSESCVVVGRPILRSVDSERAGRVIEPRKLNSRGSRRRPKDGRQHRGAVNWPGAFGPAGVRERGMRTLGFPRNLGGPVVSVPVRRPGVRLETSRPLHAAPAGRGSEQGVQGRYRQAKETKRGGTDGRESECLVLLLKRGNPSQGTPRREGGTGTWNR